MSVAVVAALPPLLRIKYNVFHPYKINIRFIPSFYFCRCTLLINIIKVQLQYSCAQFHLFFFFSILMEKVK